MAADSYAQSGVCDRCKEGYGAPPCGPEHAAEAKRLRDNLLAMARDMGIAVDPETLP